MNSEDGEQHNDVNQRLVPKAEMLKELNYNPDITQPR